MFQNKIPSAWKETLIDELRKPYIKKLEEFLELEIQKGAVIYPAEAHYFKALEQTPLESVKVVILGQDPYHGPQQAHGLSFSVRSGVKFPPSLRNIFKELQSDVGCAIPESGDLTKWAQQGVLLLNSVLTVTEAQAGSHQGKGWETFTDKIIEAVNEKQKNVVFILWGAYAIKKGVLIDRSRHLVLESVHPSPLSAHRGFFGTKPFSQANHYLVEKGRGAVNWSLV